MPGLEAGWLSITWLRLAVGIIVSFLTYSKQFGRPISDLANQFNLIQSAIVGAERVFEVLEMPSEYGDEESEDLPRLTGEVVFQDVSFAYKADSPTLSGVTFEAKPGEKIAFVGPTRAGKTTIVNLLIRFYDLSDGSIRIDGRDIRELDKNALRSQPEWRCRYN